MLSLQVSDRDANLHFVDATLGPVLLYIYIYIHRRDFYRFGSLVYPPRRYKERKTEADLIDRYYYYYYYSLDEQLAGKNVIDLGRSRACNGKVISKLVILSRNDLSPRDKISREASEIALNWQGAAPTLGEILGSRRAKFVT